MSTIKVDGIRSNSATSDAITLASDGTCTANITNNLSNRNIIINGAMQVAQRGTSTTTNGYLVDRFRSNLGGIDQMQFTMSQSTDAPTGFTRSLKFDVTTVETGGIGSDEYAGLRYIIESQDVAHLLHGTSAAKTFTLSFHAKAYQTGTYAVNFFVGDSSRIYNATYTINQSATWEKKTITVVGDTGGSGINLDNGHGIYINWFLASGSAYTSSSSALNQWSNYQDASWAHGQAVDITSSTNNYFQLTGVQFEVNDHATDFEYRSIAQELALCQRYCYKHEIQGSIGPYAMQYESGHKFVHDFFPVSMRAQPSYTITYNTSSPTPYYASSNHFKAYVSSAYDGTQPIYMSSAIYFAEL